MKIVIYGAGDIASIVATEFFEDHDIIVIDPDVEKLNQFSQLDLSKIVGDASIINVLTTAAIKNAEVFIASSETDEENIVGCIRAKNLSSAQTVFIFQRKEFKN